MVNDSLYLEACLVAIFCHSKYLSIVCKPASACMCMCLCLRALSLSLSLCVCARVCACACVRVGIYTYIHTYITLTFWWCRYVQHKIKAIIMWLGLLQLVKFLCLCQLYPAPQTDLNVSWSLRPVPVPDIVSRRWLYSGRPLRIYGTVAKIHDVICQISPQMAALTKGI